MEDILEKKEESSIEIKDKNSVDEFLSSLEEGSLEKNIAITELIFELTINNKNDETSDSTRNHPF